MSNIHLHKNRLDRDLNLLLLLIPAVIFVLTIAYILTKAPEQKVATEAIESAILGTESEILDNPYLGK